MSNESENQALLTMKESGRYLGGPKSRDFIYDLIEKGKLESIMLSPRARRVTKASLDAYIACLVKVGDADGATE